MGTKKIPVFDQISIQVNLTGAAEPIKDLNIKALTPWIADPELEANSLSGEIKMTKFRKHMFQ